MRAPALRALAALLLAAAPAAAQDRLAFGAPSGAGPYTVPITLADVPGTPLGGDRPAGSRIQAFAVTVRFTPASAVTAATLARAGLLSGRAPVFETTAAGPGTVTWVGAFDESAGPLPFSQPPTAAGDTVLALTVALVPGATGSASLEAFATTLSNQAGTAGESVDDGSLLLGPPVSLPPGAEEGAPVPAAGTFALAGLAAAIAATGLRAVRAP